MRVSVAFALAGNHLGRGLASRALRAACLCILLALTLQVFAGGAWAQGGGGTGGIPEPISVACNGQPARLKICRPPGRVCDVFAEITNADPAGVAPHSQYDVTFTGVPATGATVRYVIAAPSVGPLGTNAQANPATGTITNPQTAFSASLAVPDIKTFSISGPANVTQSIAIDRPNIGYNLASPTVTCTPKPTTGKVTIIKKSIGGTGSFSITLTKAGGAVTTVGLATTGSPDGTATSVVTLASGTYAVDEPPPADWNRDSIQCVKNAGSGSATGASLTLAAGDDVTCTVTNTKQRAGLNLKKTPRFATFNAAGQVIPFDLVVSNTGTAPLTQIKVGDPTAVLTACSVTSLGPNSSFTCTALHTATQADLSAGQYVNAATVTALDPLNVTQSASATAAVTAVATGGLQLTETVSPSTYTDAGQTLTYTFAVTSGTNVPLSKVTLADPEVAHLTCRPLSLPGTLAVGASTVCTGTRVTTVADLGAPCIVNSSTVSGLRRADAVSAAASAKACLTPDKTRRVIAGFIDRRVDLLTSNEPDNTRAIRRFGAPGTGDGPIDVTGQGNDTSANVSFATSLSRMARAQRQRGDDADGDGKMGLGATGHEPPAAALPPGFDIWTEGHFQRWDSRKGAGDRSGDFAVAYLGADYAVTPMLVIGALIEFDWMTDHSASLNTDLNGAGWMAGPYAAIKLSDNLFFDARVAAGQSSNSISPFGTYTDTFDTDRWLAKAGLTGNWQMGAFRLSPSASLIYAGETQGAYTDSLGFAIPEQTSRLGRLSFGPEIAYAFQAGDGLTVEPYASLTGMWDFDKQSALSSGGFVTAESDVRAKAEAGVLVRSLSGTSLRLSGTYDGIGSRDVSAAGGQLWLNVPLEALATNFTPRGCRGSEGGSGCQIAYAGAADIKPTDTPPAATPPPASTAPAGAKAEEPAYELPSVVIENTAKKPEVAAPAPKAKPVNDDDGPSEPPAGKTSIKKNKPNSGGGTAADDASPKPPAASGSGTGAAATIPAANTGTTQPNDAEIRANRRVAEQVTSVEEVSARDIEQKGARSLDEAIGSVPGLYVRNAPDGVPRIDIRGLRTRNVQLLLDGVPLNSTFDGQFDPRAIPVENIAKIKVTKGASSVLYGPGGNAGVIDITTKSAAPGLHGSGQAEYSPERGHEERASASYGSDSIRMFMSASALNQDHFILSDDFTQTKLQPDDTRVNSDRHDRAFYANTIWSPMAAAKFGLSINYREGDYGKPPVTLTQSESPFAQRTRFERVEGYDTFSIQSASAIKFGDSLTVRPLAYYNRLNELTNGYDDARFSTQVSSLSTREDAKTSIAGGGFQTAYSFGFNLLSVAVDAHNESWVSRGFLNPCLTSDANGDCNLTGPRQDHNLTHDIQVLSVSAEQELKLTPELSAVFGGGYAEQRKAGKSDDGITYLAGARYALTGTTVVRASAAQKIRFPTLRDLFDATRGNPNLQKEVTNNYEAGIEQQIPSVNAFLSVALFRIDAENFIENSGGQFANISALQFEGVETSVHYTGIPGLDVTAGYTLLNSENQTPGAGTKELQYRPEHKATLQASYKFDGGLTVNADYLFVAGSKTLSGGGGGGGAGSGPVQVLDLGSYHVFNLGASQDIPGTTAQLFGRIDNVTDETYVETFGMPQPGRSVFGGIRAKF